MQVSQCLISLTANNLNFTSYLTTSYLILGCNPLTLLSNADFFLLDIHFPSRRELAVKMLSEFSCIHFFKSLFWNLIFLKSFQLQHHCETSTGISNRFSIPTARHQLNFVSPSSASATWHPDSASVSKPLLWSLLCDHSLWVLFPRPLSGIFVLFLNAVDLEKIIHVFSQSNMNIWIFMYGYVSKGSNNN